MTDAPRMECEVTFLSEEEGGRKTGLPTLSGNIYRPLLVIGDPSQRKAIVERRKVPVTYSDGTTGEVWSDNCLVEMNLRVLFESGPDDAQIGKPLIERLAFPSWSASPEWENLQPGATFTIREGSNIVGYGKALRWLPAS